MKMLSLVLFVTTFLTNIANAQKLPAREDSITVTDNAGGKKILKFGLDPLATDGIDTTFGESELPPFPPSGVFEARFIGDDISLPQLGQGTYKDYRKGNMTLSVQTHELRYQPGTGTSITIIWNLTNGITGLLEDLFGGVLIKKAMLGKDSLKVTNPSILSKLKMTITYPPPNPVELVDFRTNVVGTNVELNWRTASETNNYGFEVQRHATGDEFLKIGFVAGNGTSTTALSYRFIDSDLATGTYYYRLKQIDADGSFTYSAVVEALASLAPESFVLHQNHPNPFNPVTTITFVLGRTQSARLFVCDVSGREVATLFNGQAEAGRSYRFGFDGTQQMSGMFIAHLHAGKFTQSRKMLLVR